MCKTYHTTFFNTSLQAWRRTPSILCPISVNSELLINTGVPYRNNCEMNVFCPGCILPCNIYCIFKKNYSRDGPKRSRPINSACISCKQNVAHDLPPINIKHCNIWILSTTGEHDMDVICFSLFVRHVPSAGILLPGLITQSPFPDSYRGGRHAEPHPSKGYLAIGDMEALSIDHLMT